jgi:hypothetical protein
MGMENNFRVNEDPALKAKYEEFRGWLDASLQKIDPAKLQQAINNAARVSSDPKTEKEAGFKHFYLKQALENLQRLRMIQKKDELLERLAKTDLSNLGHADAFGGLADDDDIKTAIFQLNQTCSYLAQWKFKKEFEGQIEQKSESHAEEIKKSKQELDKIKIN